MDGDRAGTPTPGAASAAAEAAAAAELPRVKDEPTDADEAAAPQAQSPSWEGRAGQTGPGSGRWPVNTRCLRRVLSYPVGRRRASLGSVARRSANPHPGDLSVYIG